MAKKYSFDFESAPADEAPVTPKAPQDKYNFQFPSSSEETEPTPSDLLTKTAIGAGLGVGQYMGAKRGMIPSSIYNLESALGSLAPLQLTKVGEAKERAQRVKELENWAKTLGKENAYEMFLPKANPPVAEPPNLVKQVPMGGTAVETYGGKFGATPLQSMESPSMQSVQQNVIPRNIKAAETIQRIAPEYGLYDIGDGRKIMLTPEQAQEMNVQRTAAFTAQSNVSQQAQDRAKKLLDQQKARAALQTSRAEQAATLAAEEAGLARSNVQALSGALASDLARLPPGLRDAYMAGQRFLTPVGKAARASTKFLGPVAAAAAPFQMVEGAQKLKSPEVSDKARGTAEVLGGAGGLATLAPWLARAGMLAPELAAGVAGTGAALAIPGLALMLHDLYKTSTPMSQNQAIGYEVAPPY